MKFLDISKIKANALLVVSIIVSRKEVRLLPKSILFCKKAKLISIYVTSNVISIIRWGILLISVPSYSTTGISPSNHFVGDCNEYSGCSKAKP